ncbi:hypothetical protein HK096_000260, partial [Nowakowskiella sp. JEL0078]
MASSSSQATGNRMWELAVNTARQALAAQVEEEEELERIQDPNHQALLQLVKVRDQNDGRIIFHDDLCDEQPVPKSLTGPPWNEEKEYMYCFLFIIYFF